MNGTNNNEYTVCPCCGETVPFRKFCTECGAPLSKASGAGSVTEQKKECAASPKPIVFALGADGAVQDPGGASEERQPVDDSGLTLLGEFCKMRVATVGGNGHDEIVLYEDEADGSFQIHTYTKYEYMPKEIHHSFRAKPGAYDALLELVETLHLDEYEGKRGFGLCGGRYICKYRKDGVLHGVTTDNCGHDGPALISQVGNLLGSFQGEEITRQP